MRNIAGHSPNNNFARHYSRIVAGPPLLLPPGGFRVARVPMFGAHAASWVVVYILRRLLNFQNTLCAVRLNSTLMTIRNIFPVKRFVGHRANAARRSPALVR